MDGSGDSWSSVIHIIELLRDDIRYIRETLDRTQDDLSKVRERLSVIEGSARVWGGVIGAIMGLAVSVIVRLIVK